MLRGLCALQYRLDGESSLSRRYLFHQIPDSFILNSIKKKCICLIEIQVQLPPVRLDHWALRPHRLRRPLRSLVWLSSTPDFIKSLAKTLTDKGGPAEEPLFFIRSFANQASLIPLFGPDGTATARPSSRSWASWSADEQCSQHLTAPPFGSAFRLRAALPRPREGRWRSERRAPRGGTRPRGRFYTLLELPLPKEDRRPSARAPPPPLPANRR